jgi:hypothetical protein
MSTFTVIPPSYGSDLFRGRRQVYRLDDRPGAAPRNTWCRCSPPAGDSKMIYTSNAAERRHELTLDPKTLGSFLNRLRRAQIIVFAVRNSQTSAAIEWRAAIAQLPAIRR